VIKRLIHRTALMLEKLFDLRSRLSWGGPDDAQEIDAYIGYATASQIILRGRVLSKLRHASAVEGQSRVRNVAQILRMFFTDEVAGVTVRCNEAEAVTDEEGYFTLLLPYDGRTGWSTEDIFVEGRPTPTPASVLCVQHGAAFMVISDIDDTVLQTGAYSLLRNLYTSFTGNVLTRQVFGDAVALLARLSGGGMNPIYYVSSSPWNLHSFLGDIFAQADLVRGPMFLRDLGLSPTKFITDGHGSHKGASIDLILGANPDLPAILLGDTGQHDAQIYRDVIDRHKGRILAVGLRAPGAGLDAADRADLHSLAQTGVLTFAESSFDGFAEAVTAAQPSLLDQPGRKERTQ
jgi:phosphatidate phosphatase APP1